MKRLVKYIDARVPKYGFWDGSKVKLTDEDNIVVRDKTRLTFLRNGSIIFCLYILLCYVPYTLLKRYVRRQWLIKTGKLIPLDRH